MAVRMGGKKTGGKGDVAFVIVNYNTRRLLEELLRFFADTALPFPYSLIIVDNNSTDGSIEYLRQQKHVTVIQNDVNIGYGRAMNKGIAASESSYVAVLNTDLILNGEALTALWEYLELNPEVGISAPLICNADGTLQGFVYTFALSTLYSDLLSKFANKRQKLRLARAEAPLQVDGVMGAFLFLRRAIIDQGKLFDEDFFFYYEDTELALRMKKRGVRCMVLPAQRIIHFGGQSSSVKDCAQFCRSKFLFIEKQYGPRHARLVYLRDCVKMRLKAAEYTVLSLFWPTQKVKNKRYAYGQMVQTLRAIRTGYLI